MTVRELIDKLNAMDKDCEVAITVEGTWVEPDPHYIGGVVIL